MRRGGTVLGAVLMMVLASMVLTAGAPAHAAGSKETKEEKKAIQSFAAGRYDEALEIYAKLYADTLNPVYLRNIGRCHQKLKQPDKAIESFRDYLDKGKNIAPDEKAQIDGYIKEMETLRDEQARQQQGQPPVTPLPSTEGQPPPAQPIPVQPVGPPPGYTTAPPPVYPAAPGPADQPSGTLVAQPGPVEPASQPLYAKWWFWTIIGAAVVAGVVAGVAVSSGGTQRPNCPTGVLCQ